MTGFFKKLKDWLFGGPPDTRTSQRSDAGRVVVPAAAEPQVRPTPVKRSGSKRDGYFVQIGFDFGTAFCKCICRDVLLDKAWIHVPLNGAHTALPFLLPSLVSFDGRTLRGRVGVDGESSLRHVKMALQKVGLKDWSAPELAPYRTAISGVSGMDVACFVEMCSIYLIAGIIGDVRKDIARRFPGSVETDYVAINMAVPVADANRPEVRSLFERVLRLAWVLADDLAGHPPMPHESLISLITTKSGGTESEEVREACFIYPEVSANVQGFVRSRTSSPGLYLFSDTGAGTVDQSVFLLARPNEQDFLTYLYAEVFPLGSSQLERFAASEDGDSSVNNLERWRLRKEAGGGERQLKAARIWLEQQLSNGSEKVIVCSKAKLPMPGQIDSLRVIFGGGGHCDIPYGSAVLTQFDGRYFRREKIEERKARGESLDLGMPMPQDLELGKGQSKWMDRLNVAYGLSFEKGQLAAFDLPSDVPHPTEELLWRPTRWRPEAPSKDEV